MVRSRLLGKGGRHFVRAAGIDLQVEHDQIGMMLLGQGQPLLGLAGGHRSHAATFQSGLQDDSGLVRGIDNQHTTTAVQSWHPPWFGRNRTSLSGRTGEGLLRTGQDDPNLNLSISFGAPQAVQSEGRENNGCLVVCQGEVVGTFSNNPFIYFNKFEESVPFLSSGPLQSRRLLILTRPRQ